jgi:hypothetical protein
LARSGESDDIMEQTQAGILQFVNQSPGFTGALIPEAQVFFVPYLLPQDRRRALNTFFRESVAINEMFPELYAQHGLELLDDVPRRRGGDDHQEPGAFARADLNEQNIPRHDQPAAGGKLPGLRRRADTAALGRGLRRASDEHDPGAGKPHVLCRIHEACTR